ncbi:hypothetical protein ACFLVQ_01065 [Chloroflexota bacterium]
MMNKKDLVKALARVVGSENVLTSLKDLIAYSYDATGKSSLPDIVVFPNDARLCHYTIIVEGSVLSEKGQINVVLVGEELGL